MTNRPAPASLPTVRHAPLAAAPRLLRPFSLALSLAYCHYYTPTPLPRNRGLPQAHLNRLTAWQALQSPRASTPLGRRRALALHLGLLHIAGFIDLTAPLLRTTPTAARWLRAPFDEQAWILRRAFDDPAAWAELSQRFQLGTVLTPDLLAWAGQYVARMTAQPSPTARAARLRVDDDAWRVRLFPDSPTGPLFDLAQAGHWQALTRNGGRLTLTRLSVAGAAGRGYDAATLARSLETLLQQPLAPTLPGQLRAWSAAGRAYRLRTVYLLETAQDEHLAALSAARRFRPYLLRRLSPRHAIVRAAIRPALETWLQRRGFVLDTPEPADALTGRGGSDTAAEWLALRVFVGLGELLPLPLPPPANRSRPAHVLSARRARGHRQPRPRPPGRSPRRDESRHRPG